MMKKMKKKKKKKKKNQKKNKFSSFVGIYQLRSKDHVPEATPPERPQERQRGIKIGMNQDLVSTILGGSEYSPES